MGASVGAAGGVDPGGAYPPPSSSVGASGPDTGKGKILSSPPHLCQELSLPEEADGREQDAASSHGSWQPSVASPSASPAHLHGQVGAEMDGRLADDRTWWMGTQHEALLRLRSAGVYWRV